MVKVTLVSLFWFCEVGVGELDVNVACVVTSLVVVGGYGRLYSEAFLPSHREIVEEGDPGSPDQIAH